MSNEILKLFDSIQATSGMSSQLPVLSPSTSFDLKDTASANVLEMREARIVGYARRSSKKEGNDSIDRQHRGLQDYAQRKFGRPLDHFYPDPSISGRTWKRPGLQQLMADAQVGKFTHIIVEDVDRIARALHIAAEFKHKCDGWNVEIHSVYKGDEIDDSDVAFRGFLSADQVKLMRERAMQGRRKKAEKGAVGVMPFGYVRTGQTGEWKIDETKQKLIEAIFDARIDGMEYSTIARILNTREIIDKSGDGKWTAGGVKKLLCNPKYMGVNVFGLVKKRFDPEAGRVLIESGSAEELLISELPQWAIVSKEKWHAAFKTHQRPTSQKLKREHSLLSSEHAVCATCGTKLRSLRTRTSNDWELRCKVRDCRETVGYRVKIVEEQMLRAVRLVLTDPAYEASFDAQVNVQYERVCVELADRRKTIEKRIRELDDDLEELLDEVINLKKRKKHDIDVEHDELHEFEGERLARRVKKRRAELQAARLQLTMLPISPAKPDPGQRARLLQAYDRIVEARKSTVSRSGLEDELHAAAEAAIGNMVEKITVGSIYPGRAVRYEVALRLEPIYGDMANGIEGGRRSVVSVVHPTELGQTDEGTVLKRATEAYRSRILAATDEEFFAVDPAISPRIRAMLGSVSWTARAFIDLVFLATRSSIKTEFLRTELPRNVSSKVHRAFTESMAESDGTWRRIFKIVKDRFPALYNSMNPDAFPIHSRERNNRVRKKREKKRLEAVKA